MLFMTLLLKTPFHTLVRYTTKTATARIAPYDSHSLQIYTPALKNNPSSGELHTQTHIDLTFTSNAVTIC